MKLFCSTPCRILCAVSMLSLLPACSLFGFWHHRSHTVPVTGSLHIAPEQDFVYLPAQTTHQSPHRIENTAVSGILLKQEVRAAVRDAVAAQLQLAGFDTTGPSKVLSGQIEKCSVDDERSPARWTLRIRYIVTDTQTGRVVFSSVKTVRHEAPKFTSNPIALEDTVRESVNALIDDSAFAQALIN
ncbi:hypothetical protein [Paraburkholderia acidicola]|nr:hypothetical protein [Paraburkholderia acidicola]